MTVRSAPLAFFVVSTLFSVLFAVTTPPFSTPDETGHWVHALAISRGHAWAQVPAVTVPRWSVQLIASHMADGPASLQRAARFDVPRDGTPQVVQLHNVSAYGAAGYLPAVPGLVLARMFRAAPESVFRAGRVSAALICSAILALALALAGARQALLSLAALAPMAVALRGSYSPDALLFAAAFLLVCLLLSDRVPAAAIVLACAATLTVVAIKPPYAPLAIAAAVTVVFRSGSSSKVRSTVAVALTIAALAAGAHGAAGATAAARKTQFRMDAPVDAAAQLHFVAAHPLQTSAMVARDLGGHAPQYVNEMIGVLGWLDVPMPRWLSAAWCLGLLSLLVAGGSVDVSRANLVILAAALLTVLLAGLSVYAAWTPVGAPRLEGFQGRYLLPLLPFLALLPTFRRSPEPVALLRGALAFAAVLLAVALQVTLAHYG